ncbi:WD40/YVTN/BNR-like repeat-containing protein [Pseudofrankia saprophytica]|uniref:WD40/YVTN/BNR-like repeat-containing protein n=1 Tax=Pseudofrankia saprophytica TaxID=298655 RepID=UPI000234C2B0|nr:hypothetical protein [Pseudofrankia saprophytica]
MVATVLLVIGTRKGLWLARSRDGRASWEVTGPHHPMVEVYSAAIDTRGPVPRVLVGLSSEWFGPNVAISDDLGASWREPATAPIAFPTGTDTALRRVWQITPGPVGEPDVVYAGVEPSALFRSTDGGRSFELVQGLWDHPHRPDWEPGYGGQAIHTVLPDPVDHKRITVAMSSGGVYRTLDGGENWSAANKGIKAGYLPDPYPEFGQCVHKVAPCPVRPERLYAQNHGGVYRSDDGADSWVSIADGLPSDFGFAMVAHPSRRDVIYNFPLKADSERFPPDGRCRVYRSEDAGASWEPRTAGLPEEGFWTAVLRDSMCSDDADPAGVYFGSRTGEVYASRDEGDSWVRVAAHLPDVTCVRAAVV